MCLWIAVGEKPHHDVIEEKYLLSMFAVDGHTQDKHW